MSLNTLKWGNPSFWPAKHRRDGGTGDAGGPKDTPDLRPWASMAEGAVRKRKTMAENGGPVLRKLEGVDPDTNQPPPRRKLVGEIFLRENRSKEIQNKQHN